VALVGRIRPRRRDLLEVLLTGHVMEATTAFCASVGYVVRIAVGMDLELRYRNGDGSVMLACDVRAASCLQIG
jgi:hypothetical protein